MNETRTINLNGLVYHIDYDAYKCLHDYLSDIEQRLPQQDRQEVMADLEARIAELFQKALFAKNVQVVSMQMVQSVKAQIGEPKEFGPNSRPKVRVDHSHNDGCRRMFSIALNVVLAILALPVIVFGLIVLCALVFTFFGVTIAGTTIGATMPLVSALAEVLMEGNGIIILFLLIALLLIVVLPIVMIVHTIVTFMRTRRGPKARFWWITILFWVASVIFWSASLVRFYHAYEHAPQLLSAMTMDDFDVDDAGVATSALQLDAYHSVELRGAAQLHLSQAAVPSTTLTTNMLHSLVTGEDNWLAEVRDSVLYIDVTTQMSLDEVMLDFAIASPDLRKITVYGASKIETLDGQILTQPSLALDLNGAAQAELHLHVQTLMIDAKGASQLELSGTADEVRVTIAGAGELEAEDLVAQTLHINCAGASKAEVNVVRELWAQAAGASKITYKGAPQIRQNLAVGGSVIRRD
jgi:hypothetical protein